MLYRAARWDNTFDRWGKLGFDGKPRFHILECIRFLNYEWGILAPTGFSRAASVNVGQRKMERYLMLHKERDDRPLAMWRNMPLTEPLFQVPNILVLFMVLFYFSTLARAITLSIGRSW